MSNSSIRFNGIVNIEGFPVGQSVIIGRMDGIPYLMDSKFVFEFPNGLLHKFYLPVETMPRFNEIADGNIRTFYYLNFPETLSDGNSFYNAYSFDTMSRYERKQFPIALRRLHDDLISERLPDLYWSWRDYKHQLIAYINQFLILAERQLEGTQGVDAKG